jgi:hypothetical protein
MIFTGKISNTDNSASSLIAYQCLIASKRENMRLDPRLTFAPQNLGGAAGRCRDNCISAKGGLLTKRVSKLSAGRT